MESENNEDELMGHHQKSDNKLSLLRIICYRKDLDYNMNELIIFSMRGATKIE
jgi:hypothetical protein